MFLTTTLLMTLSKLQKIIFHPSKQILRTEEYGLLMGVFKVKAKGKGNVVTQFFFHNRG